MTGEPSRACPQQVGPYRILDVLGEGGMGTVYLAEQKEPVRRRAAVKVVKLGMDSKAVLARFEAERKALAMMEHHCIATVFDAGLTAQGQPWFAMEYVKGIPITEYCDRNKVGLRERIKLFQQVCSGVQHAHLKGVMHRDLKPSNVLVTVQDGKAVPKIIDFGLAKATDHHLVEATIYTQHGQFVGTPEYMSPEQAGLDGLDVDTRTDVYSLGVLLYELLTGDVPFARRELRQAGHLEMQRVIREQDPVRPSTRVSSLGASASEIATVRQTDAASLQRRLRGDLDWIALKALEKDRTRRYETAHELAADLQRHLDHEPVLASPPGVAYRLKKLVRRHRGQFAAAGLVLLTAVVGAVVALEQRSQALASARLATELAAEKGRTVDHFQQLAGIVRLEDARRTELELWPPWPGRIAAMEAWLRDHAGRLVAMRPKLEATVSDLRRGAVPGAGDAQAWTFPADAEGEAARFLHDALAGLLRDLGELERVQQQDVARRLRWARALEAGLCRAHPQARVSWAAARDAIAKADGTVASTLYEGQPIALEEDAVTGLVPIGMNPVTKLWEFYDLRSAWDGTSDPAAIAIPSHRPDGSTEVTEQGGIVFVLLPGGTFTMGSQRSDPSAPNHDSEALADEVPHPVQLAPFLLARHELTQAQWARLCTWDAAQRQPSFYAVGQTAVGRRITGTHPVEQVDWAMCEQLLTRYGMVLPTEAQWEYACRAGTATPWVVDLAQLPRHANVASAEARASGSSWVCESWEDGHVIHAPVGSFAPNPFGLFDLHGNVFEWCRDGAGDYGTERRGDGLRQGDAEDLRVVRGGSFANPSAQARSANRLHNSASIRDDTLGLRAARLLRP
jgi:serine/threonine protein kinase/formylglycine-generating enzyme required for sulfatase activity